MGSSSQNIDKRLDERFRGDRAERLDPDKKVIKSSLFVAGTYAFHRAALRKNREVPLGSGGSTCGGVFTVAQDQRKNKGFWHFIDIFKKTGKSWHGFCDGVKRTPLPVTAILP